MATPTNDSYSVASGQALYAGRFAPSSLPAWRTAMTSTDTLYEVGAAWNDATLGLVPKYVWPEADRGGYLFSGTDAWNSPFHDAYGGSVFVPEVGAHGTMVFGLTGEAVIYNQLSSWGLSEDSPQWRLFQQPQYPTSSGQATSMDADWYYSVADYAALASGKKIDAVGEATFSASWDGSFPVGYRNWVARRKYTAGGIVGNTMPWWFRYGMPCYIPPAMTGTSAGAIITNSRGTIYGPFGQGSIPTGGSDSMWYSELYGSGRRKNWLHAMNPQTKAWQRLTTELPDFTGFGGYVEHPYSAVDRANKRVYYTAFNGSNWATYYADFSAGLAGMTINGPTNLTDLASQPAASQAANSVFCVPQTGVNAGRRLWYLREASTSNLLLIDLDNNTLRRLSITGLPSSSEWWGFGYDSASNVVYITTKGAFGVRSYRFTIPSDPTSAASYSVTLQTIALNGITLETVGGWLYGERTRFNDSLGVILINQRFGKMLAYRPS